LIILKATSVNYMLKKSNQIVYMSFTLLYIAFLYIREAKMQRTLLYIHHP